MMLASRYRILDEIGVGGMGRVHLACVDGPGGFQKWIAIKRLHGHLLRDESVIRMFIDEGRIAARISHPNVATVIDFGEVDGDYFIAMEYLHGEPLREIARALDERGLTMPPQIACRIVCDVAEGLHAAHELTSTAGEPLSLVHRDVSPHNVFVTYEGVTKVVDFGVAKIRSMTATTGVYELKGKLAYMSPEQASGGAVDRRTDVFALGVVMWELMTGRRLFRGENDLETLDNVRTCDVPRPSTLVPNLPLELDEIIMKALARDPDQRYATARHFARAIQLMLMGRSELVTRDDVASFMRTLMPERIAQREAHLREIAEPDADSTPPEPCTAATLTNPTRVECRMAC